VSELFDLAIRDLAEIFGRVENADDVFGGKISYAEEISSSVRFLNIIADCGLRIADFV
jgi:hypothetical protein